MLRLPLVLAVSLTIPAAAAAYVRSGVRGVFLGGGVAPANVPPQAPAVDPAVTGDLDAGEIDLSDGNFWSLVWPSAAAAIAMPDEVAACDEDTQPGSCGLWGDDAATLTPGAATQAVAPGQPLEATVAVARSLRPVIGAWMASQTPRLTWAPTPGASHYNVQIYLGPRRVASAWTSKPSLLIPPRAIDQGRYYMWSVWPAFGPRATPRFGEQIGRSVFGVILRPRIVFRSTPNGVRGEVRPRIPGGLLSLSAPRGLTGRVPKRVRIGADSRFALAISKRDAERLAARLLDPGPTPPRGIRRSG